MIASVNPGILFKGFAAAILRQQSVYDEDAAFAAAFESLNWIVCINDMFKEKHAAGWDWLKDLEGSHSGPGVRELAGLRYVRNSVHHKWADAVEQQSTPMGAASIPLLDEWIWRGRIPRPTRDRGRTEYEQLLAGRPVLDSMKTVARAFVKHHTEMTNVSPVDLEYAVEEIMFAGDV